MICDFFFQIGQPTWFFQIGQPTWLSDCAKKCHFSAKKDKNTFHQFTNYQLSIQKLRISFLLLHPNGISVPITKLTSRNLVKPLI